MKKIILLFMLLASAEVFGQGKKSVLENFTENTGSLYEKAYLDIGKIKNVSLQYLTITNLLDGTKISGLRMEQVFTTGYSTDIEADFLDSDEVDGFIKASEYIQKIVLTQNRKIYTEVVFKTKSRIELCAFFDQKKKEWKVIIKVNRYKSSCSQILNSEDLNDLINSLKTAHQWLNDAKEK